MIKSNCCGSKRILNGRERSEVNQKLICSFGIDESSLSSFKMGAIEPMIRYFLVTSLVIYLAFRAWKGVAKVKENVTGIAFEKIPQANVFKHPLYTFCPDFDASVIPLRKGKITPKTTLRQMTRDTIKPHNFIVSVSDG